MAANNLLSYCYVICNTAEKPFFTHPLELVCAHCWDSSKMNYRYTGIGFTNCSSTMTAASHLGFQVPGPWFHASRHARVMLTCVLWKTSIAKFFLFAVCKQSVVWEEESFSMGEIIFKLQHHYCNFVRTSVSYTPMSYKGVTHGNMHIHAPTWTYLLA